MSIPSIDVFFSAPTSSALGSLWIHRPSTTRKYVRAMPVLPPSSTHARTYVPPNGSTFTTCGTAVWLSPFVLSVTCTRAGPEGLGDDGGGVEVVHAATTDTVRIQVHAVRL